MSLRKRAMKVRLNISAWKGMKKDSRIEGEVASAHNVKGKAGKWQGNLFPGADTELKSVLDAETAIRSFFYSNTRKWNDGEQIITSQQYQSFVEEISKLMGLFEQRVDTFLSSYEDRKVQALANRGTLASPSDYPSLDEVKAKFEIRLRFYPLEDAGDFRLDIPEEENQKLARELEEGVGERLQVAMQDSKDRILFCLDQALQNLRKVKGSGRYRGEWHQNLSELLNVADAFNLTEDDGYAQGVQEVRIAFEKMDEEAIAEDTLGEGARADAANAVEKIMANMGSFFGEPLTD